MKNQYYILFFITTLLFSCRAQESAMVNGIKITPEEQAQRDSLNRMTASSLVVEGMTRKMIGNRTDAMQSFNNCLRVEPDNDAALFQLSLLYMEEGSAAQAVQYGERAVQLQPDNEWYVLHMAELYQRTGDFKSAVSSFDKLIKLRPDRREYYYYYADALVRNGEEVKSVEVLDKLEKKYGFDEDAVIQKYRIYSYLKKYPEAIAEINKLIEHNPYEVTNYGIIAELYEELGQEDKALEYYNKVLAIDPDNGVVHLSLAQYYNNKGDENRSFEELKKSYASRSLETDMKIKILYDYYDAGKSSDKDKKESYELLEILVATNGDDPKTWAIYGDFLARDNRFDEAAAKYRKALELDENIYLLWNQLLLVDTRLDDQENLYRDAARASELFPVQPLMKYYHGLGAYQSGKFEEAREQLETGKDLVVDNDALLLEFYQLLGDCLNKLKDYEASDAAYESALQIDPNNAYVMNNYAYYLSLRKHKLTRAAELSKRSNELQPDQASFEDTYAYILFVQKKYDEAQMWIVKALGHGGNNSGTILEHYGDILFHQGKTSDAVEYWIKAKNAGGAGDKIDQKIKDKKYYDN